MDFTKQKEDIQYYSNKLKDIEDESKASMAQNKFNKLILRPVERCKDTDNDAFSGDTCN